MKGTHRFLVGCSAVLAATLSAGVSFSQEIAPDPPPVLAPPPSYPLFEGPLYRYPNLNIFGRIGTDLIAIPAGVGRWNAADWSKFGAVVVPTVALMWPTNPSLDVELQTWIVDNRTPGWNVFFPRLRNTEMSVGTLAYVGIFWGLGWVTGDSTILELASLSSEALTVAQAYHVSMKILMGREGPAQENRLGNVHGPSTEFYPAGTPSGHATTTGALLSVFAEYFDNWAVSTLAIAGTTYVSASLIYNDQHFASDVIWGASMGWAVGTWVVRHRSTRFRNRGEQVQRVQVLPLAVPGGLGATVGGVW